MDWQPQPSDERASNWNADAPSRSIDIDLAACEPRGKRWTLHGRHGGTGRIASSSFGPHIAPGYGPAGR